MASSRLAQAWLLIQREVGCHVGPWQPVEKPTWQGPEALLKAGTGPVDGP